MPGLGPTGWAPPAPAVAPVAQPQIAQAPTSSRAWIARIVVGVPIALVIAVFASVTVVPFVLRWEPFIVTSASMTPTIAVGSVVVVDPTAAQTMKVGDVGTFVAPESGLRVTHRVVEVQGGEGPARVYITKGDAVRNPDGPRGASTAVGSTTTTEPTAIVGVIEADVTINGSHRKTNGTTVTEAKTAITKAIGTPTTMRAIHALLEVGAGAIWGCAT